MRSVSFSPVCAAFFFFFFIKHKWLVACRVRYARCMRIGMGKHKFSILPSQLMYIIGNSRWKYTITKFKVCVLLWHVHLWWKSHIASHSKRKHRTGFSLHFVIFFLPLFLSFLQYVLFFCCQCELICSRQYRIFNKHTWKRNLYRTNTNTNTHISSCDKQKQ